MRGRPFAWVALVLTLSASLSAGWGAAQAPEGLLRPSVAPASGDLATAFLFRVEAEPEVGPGLLENGGFGANLSGWRNASNEIGGGAIFEWAPERDGHLVVRVPEARSDGSVFAFQDARLTGAPSYEFAFASRGTDVRYQVLLRESGFNATRHGVERQMWDTRVEGRVAPEWAARSEAWTPRFPDSTHVRVYLRFLVAANQGAEVRFDDASLRPVSRVSWDVDGDGAPDATGAEATWRFRTPGEREVVARHARLDGSVDEGRVRVDVVNRAPTFALDAPTSVPLDEPARFEVRDLRDPDAAELLQNGDFSDGSRAWITRDGEVGGGASFEVVEDGGPALRVRAQASQPGSVYAYQPIPLHAQEPLVFTARYRDSGTVQHQWLLREGFPGGSVDTHVELPSSPEWREVERVWTPIAGNATQLNVYLRVILAQGAGGEASFADVSLRPAVNVTWTWPDGSVSHGPSVERAFATPGERPVVVRATDAAGAFTERSFQVRVVAPLSLRVEGARLARAGDVVSWRAFPEDAPGNLLDAGFGAAWAFSARETGVDGAWRAAPGPGGATAELSVAGATSRGSVYLHQTVPVEPRRAYRFQVEGASNGAVETFQYLLRERGFNQTAEGAPRAFHDTPVALAPSSAGHAVDVAWTPRYNGTTHVTVYLRAIVPNGSSADVSFRAPRLVPEPSPRAADVAWEGPGCAPCAGGEAPLRADEPGVREVRVSATSPDGGRARAVAPLLVVRALPSAVRALDGSLLLRWETPAGFVAEYAWQDAQGRRERLDVRSAPEGEVVAHEARAPAPEVPQPSALVAITPSGDAIRLASFGPALPKTSMTTSAGSALFLRPWAPGVVRVHVADPYVVLVEARLLDADGEVVESIELASAGEGAFVGEIPFAWGRLGRSFAVDVVAMDAAGASEALRLGGPARVTLADQVDLGRPAVWMVGLLAFGALGVGAWRRWGSRRGA